MSKLISNEMVLKTVSINDTVNHKLFDAGVLNDDEFIAGILSLRFGALPFNHMISVMRDFIEITDNEELRDKIDKFITLKERIYAKYINVMGEDTIYIATIVTEEHNEVAVPCSNYSAAKGVLKCLRHNKFDGCSAARFRIDVYRLIDGTSSDMDYISRGNGEHFTKATYHFDKDICLLNVAPNEYTSDEQKVVDDVIALRNVKAPDVLSRYVVECAENAILCKTRSHIGYERYAIYGMADPILDPDAVLTVAELVLTASIPKLVSGVSKLVEVQRDIFEIKEVEDSSVKDLALAIVNLSDYAEYQSLDD